MVFLSGDILVWLLYQSQAVLIEWVKYSLVLYILEKLEKSCVTWWSCKYTVRSPYSGLKPCPDFLSEFLTLPTRCWMWLFLISFSAPATLACDVSHQFLSMRGKPEPFHWEEELSSVPSCPFAHALPLPSGFLPAPSHLAQCDSSLEDPYPNYQLTYHNLGSPMVILFHSTLNTFMVVTSIGGEHRLAGDGVTGGYCNYWCDFLFILVSS